MPNKGLVSHEELNELGLAIKERLQKGLEILNRYSKNDDFFID